MIRQLGGESGVKLSNSGCILGTNSETNSETQENLFDQRPLVGYISNDLVIGWRSGSQAEATQLHTQSKQQISPRRGWMQALCIDTSLCVHGKIIRVEIVVG